jgi:sarcosine oxidase
MRVIVVGVGGIGAAACWRLAERGAEVVGLEQFDIGHKLGSSHGESRLIRQAYFEHPDYVPLLREAFAGWRALDPALLQATGLALAGPPAGEVLAGSLRSAAGHGISVRHHSDARTCPELAAFSLPSGFAALVEPGAGWLPVETCVLAMADAARRAGADLRERVQVRDWQIAGDSVMVATSAGPLRGDRLVLTQGAWAGPVLRRLGVTLTVHRNLLFWLPVAPQFADAPCFGLDLPGGFLYGFVAHDGVLKLALHRPGEVVSDPLQVDRSLRSGEADEVLAMVRAHLPHVRPEILRHVVCLYEMSPDGHFVLDTLPGVPQVSLAAGFSGHGFKFAPVMGEVLAELALDGRSRHPVEFLSARRFG